MFALVLRANVEVHCTAVRWDVVVVIAVQSPPSERELGVHYGILLDLLVFSVAVAFAGLHVVAGVPNVDASVVFLGGW